MIIPTDHLGICVRACEAIGSHKELCPRASSLQPRSDRRRRWDSLRPRRLLDLPCQPCGHGMKEKADNGTFLLFKATLATVPSATEFSSSSRKATTEPIPYTQSSTPGRQTAHMLPRDGTRTSAVLSEKCQKGHLRHHRYRRDHEDISEGPHSRQQISTHMSENRIDQWRLTSKIESG